jgi:DNA-binding PadR family transcriptional regulator
MSIPKNRPWERASRKKSYERLTGLQIGFLVLLALAASPANGGEISRRIVGDTLGQYVRDSSLYDELRRLEEAGLVERYGTGWPHEMRITDEGDRYLRLSVRTMGRLMEVARERGLT